MARKCAVCGKGVTVGIKLSHSHIRTKRVWVPNLQRIKIILNGAPRKVSVCTSCIRSGRVKRAI
ncbi:MAG: 50S ribosomal protein L28 [Peptococcaceae bacterium]|jgi:large subunit ribosomal protein L28|nr:MAG: 50S ribosomal protein L28 [Peptococcaceae bacterium]